MDIHRCRFVPYPPSAINALAFSQTSSTTLFSKTPSPLRLAIGRASGDIEIWNPSKGAWYQETILRGGKDRSIEGLVWTQDPEDTDRHGYKLPGKLRLFSIGYSTAVTEWDLALGKRARHSAGNYGEIWCMAAQPRAAPSVKKNENDEVAEFEAQTIAVGCADGGIMLMSTADDDLRFMKLVARSTKKKARVLSLTFQNRHNIVAGHADSTIRIYDLRNGQQVRSMTLGGGPKGGPRETLVWSVRCLSDGGIISGDSTGTVCFWDSTTSTLVQRIKSHDADILDIAISADGQSAFSGGMDRRTVLYRRSGGGKAGGKLRWAKVTHSRLHEHDVKAMATFESKGFSVLASGGLDTNPIIVPIQEFGKEHHRSLSSLPQQPALLSVPKRRLLASWWDREVSIWAISRGRGPHSEHDPNRDNRTPQGRKLVAKIALTGDESITSVGITSDGTLLAVSTITEIKVFRLRPKEGSLRVQKLAIPSSLSLHGAKLLTFSPDSKWLSIVLPSDKIQIHRLSSTSDLQQLPHFLRKAIKLTRLTRNPGHSKPSHGTLGPYSRSINRLTFSSDSAILAATDLSGYIDTWVLEGHEDLTQPLSSSTTSSSSSSTSSSSDSEDSENNNTNEEIHPSIILGQHWILNPSAQLLPKLPSTPLVLSFRPSSPTKQNGIIAPTPPSTRHTPHPHSHDLPSGEDRLLVITAGNKILEFNVLSGRLSDWSRRNPTSAFPEKYRELRDQARGLIWDLPADEKRERVWIYGVSWLWMFDLSRDMTDQPPQAPTNGDVMIPASKALIKRKRNHISADEDDDDDPGRTRGTGAGSKVPNSKLHTGVGRKMRRIEGDAGESKIVSLDHRRERDAASDDDDDDEELEERDNHLPLLQGKRNALLRLRRGDTTTAAAAEDVDEDVDADAAAKTAQPNTNDTLPAIQSQTQAPPHWHTFKYRPILGIVALSPPQDGRAISEGEGEGELDDQGEEGREDRGVEVALVERPLWDVDLPARFYGAQEWET